MREAGLFRAHNPIGRLPRRRATCAFDVRLITVANVWNERMGVHQRYPETYAKSPKTLPRRRAERADAAFVAVCRRRFKRTASRPPRRARLSRTRPRFYRGRICPNRVPSRAQVVPLRRGGAAAFAVHNRPVKGTKSTYRVNPRRGVSRIILTTSYTRHHLS
jgi:hypothetical protein